jgi:hypothetical protein
MAFTEDEAAYLKPQFPMEVSGRANHHDPVTSPHLPGGKAGSSPPRRREFQQRTDMGRARLGALPNQPQPMGDPP